MVFDDAAAAGPSSRHPADAWRCVLGGLQQNCQQFGINLARLQHTIGKQLEAQCRRVQHQYQGQQQQQATLAAAAPVASLSQTAAAGAAWGGSSSGGGAVSREEVGRATWTFLHTLAAQYPEKPTRQQQRDVRNLVDILTRMYPCGECARHFKEVVRQQPPAVGSRRELALWMCEVHNLVNRRLGKPSFNCSLVEARWSSLECGEADGEGGQDACSLEVGRRRRR